jgi:hypothetical protein
MKTYYNVITADGGDLYECEISTLELARAHSLILSERYNPGIFSGHEDYVYFKIEKIISEIVE